MNWKKIPSMVVLCLMKSLIIFHKACARKWLWRLFSQCKICGHLSPFQLCDWKFVECMLLFHSSRTSLHLHNKLTAIAYKSHHRSRQIPYYRPSSFPSCISVGQPSSCKIQFRLADNPIGRNIVFWSMQARYIYVSTCILNEDLKKAKL